MVSIEAKCYPKGVSNIPGVDVIPVSEWIEANIEGARGPFGFTPITGGHSNLTIAVGAADGQRFVLRRPPLAAVLATAHDMSREHRSITAARKIPIPAPTPLGFCDDESVNGAPFYVMDFVDGVVLHDSEIAAEALPEIKTRRALSESVIDTLADFHLADPDDVGLGDLGRREGYLDRQLSRWQKMWEATKTRDLQDMEDAYKLLLEQKPEQKYSTIVHGDYRLGNMLIDPEAGKVNAVLDWELCTLGDPLADLGYLLNNWVMPGEEDQVGATAYPTLIGGFLSREEMVQRYLDRTGFETANPDYYRAFQYWRLGAIVEGVLSRYKKGALDNEVDLDAFVEQVNGLAAHANELLEAP